MATWDKSLEMIRTFISCPPGRMVVVGPRRVGKHELVRNELLTIASEQDLLEIDGSMDGARQVQQFVGTYPIDGEVRAVLVDGRRSFSDFAQDAYLKICEDPPPAMVLMMIVDDDGSLRPALRSRLDVVRLPPLSAEETRGFLHESDIDPDDFIVSVAHGRNGLCKPLSARLEQMKNFHVSACEAVKGGSDFSAVPNLILEWAKLEEDEKDAVLAVCELVLRADPEVRTGRLAEFVDTMTSIPSANAEIHWWRFRVA